MASNTVSGEAVTPSDLVGTSVQRSEDPHLITGDAEYSDDIQFPRQVHLAILRSQHAHARITGIDAADALALDGVIAVYTADDIEASGVPGLLPNDAPGYTVAPDRPLLAGDRVRYQGEPIAGVVAEDRYTAHEALDVIDVGYERLDAVADPREAVEDDAPTIHDEAPDNVAFVWENGDADAVAAAMDDADRVLEFEVGNNRIVPTAMEPRAAAVRYKGSTGEFEMAVSTQNPHKVQGDLAAVLGVADHKIHVRPPDVGGGFGAKLQPYTGHILAAWCAMELERPVKWTANRTEDFLAMVHSRHQTSTAAVAVTDDGEMTGMRVRTYGDIGSYVTLAGPNIHTGNFGQMFVGQYAVPAAHIEVTGVFTNTTPISAYRGAGRPEATYFIERIVEMAARELDMDPVAFRRKNFIPPSAFPYETPIGHNYDSGAYEHNMEVALSTVDYEAFRERQASAREEGRYLGIGLSCYVEACGSAPGWPETGAVRVKPSGNVILESGTAEIGTGHRTGYTQIVADKLGVPFDNIEVIEGDTATLPEGGGTGGSRAMAVGGSALFRSAEKVIEKAQAIAAHQLEAAPEDVAFTDGEFHVRGAPDRSITMEEVAAKAYEPWNLPDDMEPGLEASSYYNPSNYTYPFGTHVAIVEVDPTSGEIEFERYVAVDDVGAQINPKLIEGQIHGGVIQGVGQAIYEHTVYDENGQLLTGSLQDYAVPKAEHAPELEWDSTITESPHNPLGVKGVGEAGAIGAPPAVVNAVVDALYPLGVEHLEMPLTGESVWRAVQDASN